jgi:hypothetical protein
VYFSVRFNEFPGTYIFLSVFFWDVTPSIIVKGYQKMRGTCYLHVGDVTLEVEAPGSREAFVSKD